MAINDEPYKSDFLILFRDMSLEPMSDEDYAARLAAITDKQIKTAEALAGIPVSTTGSETAQTGKTTANGVII
jgi:Zn-dependent peptidase ImmA (M78 family)